MQKTDYRLAQLRSPYYKWQLEQQQKKAFEDLMDMQVLEPGSEPICQHFGCGATLTLAERLAGDKCTSHSTEQPKADVSKYGSY